MGLFGGSGGSSITAPDLSQYQNASSQIGNSAQASGQAQADWAKQQVGNQVNQTTAAQGTLGTQAGQAFGAGAQGQAAYGNAVGAANQNLAAAQQWGSPAGVQQAQAAAAAQVGQSYDAARQNNMRQLAAYGVDPSQLKGAFGNLQGNLAQAGAVGNATYGAGQTRQLQGMQLTNQAIGQNAQLAGVGQGYTGQGASMTGQGVQLGNQTLATGSQAMLAPSQWSQVALGGQGQAANIGTQSFQNNLAANQYNAGQQGDMLSGIGTIVGGLAGAYFTGGSPQGAMAGAAIGSKLADGGGIGPTHYADGDIVVPSIYISPVSQTRINPGAKYAAPQGGGGLPLPSLGGLGGGGGKSSSAGIADNYQPSDGAPMQMNAADGGTPHRQLQRKRAIPGNGAQYSPAASRPPVAPQGVGMGTAGPMQYANGGMSEVNPNPERQGGVPQPRPMHMQNYHLPSTLPHPPHLTQLPHAQRMQQGHFADGQGPQWGSAGLGYADGQNVQQGPGFVAHGMSDGTGIDDQVPAKISVGEYVIPADVVHAKGKEFFDKLLERYHTPAQQQRQQMGIPQRGMQ